MRVVIFTDAYPPFINGVATSCYNLVNTLKEHGHDVLVVTPRKEDGKLLVENGVIYMPGIKLKKMFGYRVTKLYDHKVAKMVKDFDPDLIHSQTDSTVGMFSRIVAKRYHIPLVYTYHTSMEDYTHYASHGFMDRFMKWFLRTYSRIQANTSTEFITPSEKTKEHIRSIGSEMYASIIPTGIDFSLFKEENIDKERAKEIKASFNIPEDAKVILLIGRVAIEKSMDLNIKYFADYLHNHSNANFHMLIVGDGPMKEPYELLAHELGISKYVHFAGFRPAEEMPLYYYIADIYSSASITETQGLTYQEAMAAKTIVLARFDNNLSEVIIEGRTGFYFSSSESFSNKIDLIFSMDENKRQEIIDNAYASLDKFSIEKFYDNIIEVYKRAIRKFW